MLHTPTTAPAVNEEQRKELLRKTEQESIREVARREGAIGDVGKAQRTKIDALFEHAGSDGAEQEVSPALRERLLEDAKEHDAMRKERVGDDMKIAALPDNVVGLQKDSDRSVYLDESLASVEANKAQVEEVKIHELQHTKQAKSNDTGPVELTGDKEADALLSLQHEAYRENDAMQEAGWEFTSAKYITDYQQPVNRVREYLKKGGESADELVHEASLNGKMRELRDGIRRSQIRQRLSTEPSRN